MLLVDVVRDEFDFNWPGGEGVFKADVAATGGDWNGAEAKLCYRNAADDAWVEVSASTTVSADGGGVFTQEPCRMAIVVSGDADPVKLSLRVSTPGGNF